MNGDRITQLSAQDETWLVRAEAHILEVMRAKYGFEKFARSESDLGHLQRLFDDRVITAKDLLGAQCIGVVLGNLFVETTSMRWMRVANEFGDMISLHSEAIHFTLYPLSMISKRLEDGRKIDLVALYEDLATSLHIKNELG
jgi:hypothetical protein